MYKVYAGLHDRTQFEPLRKEIEVEEIITVI
jgi:hypothetical protein